MGKRAAEDAARAHRLPLTALRVPIVHGLGDPEQRLLVYLARALDGGPVLLPEGGVRPVRHVFAEGVIDAILALLGAPDALGAFHQTQDETPSLAELVGHLFTRIGRTPDIVPIERQAIADAGLSVRDVSPLSGRWASFLDPSRLRARGIGHPPLGEMIAALVHGQLSLGAPIALPTRTWERTFAGR
jgi:nucleoside-diphosphate-sugar epimerase